MDGDTLASVSLDDKYTATAGRVFLTGLQALVRLPIMQRQRDLAGGLETAGFISGYRGSPIGGYDVALWQASKHLEENNILFRPGLNEDLAATAIWGTQQLDFVPGRKVDGVFAIWYGKGPGVDRSGDALKHANYAGTHPNGGVLLACGDDHPGKSSTLAHQSDQALAAHGIPVLFPASVQEILDLGLHGFALSRFAGTLVGFKCVNETIAGTATVAIDPGRVSITLPDDAPMPEGGVHIRPEYDPVGQDTRLVRYKLPRAQAYVRANTLDRVRLGAERPKRLGIVTTGKATLDTIAGLARLGIDNAAAKAMGLGVYKVAMVWPLEPEGLKAFAAECEELMFVEEKRPVIEDQARAILYDLAERPRISGKHDTVGAALLPPDFQLEAATVADAVARRMQARGMVDDDIEARWTVLQSRIGRNLPGLGENAERTPYFCSGCPHNTSTKVPEGSLAMAGIGCHAMAMLVPDRRTLPVTQMGGEGVNWTGMAPFTETAHIFQNLGDGTYVHSGILAIRAAVQSGANVTYKILYNDAAAMTGGQPVEGGLDVATIARQVLDEGVRRLAVVSDDPDKFRGLRELPAGIEVHHRDDLDAVQKTMREIAGTTAILYEQTCAAEKRRRRKRGRYPDPARRAFINPLVCEGCGDCSTQANCVSIHPLETPLGRKRVIDQSSCNKDYSCLKGFCPAFVTVEGGELRKPAKAAIPDDLFADLPAPAAAAMAGGEWGMLVAGIGGTGVVTISAVLGMAAHLEGKGAAVFDMTGLSQKNGAVYSHLKISAEPGAEPSQGIGLGEADLLLGCDLVAAVAPSALHAVEPERTRAVINTDVVATAAFQSAPELTLDGGLLAHGLAEHVGAANTHGIDASRIALSLTGDTIGANSLLIGYAAQMGCLPLSVAAIEKAIEVNGVAVAFNLLAFRLGRLAAAKPEAIAALMPASAAQPVAEDLEAMIARRGDFLTDYQDAAYAARYRGVVEAARAAEAALGGSTEFAAAVARYAFKVMAYKDEYEVARLYADPAFARRLRETFAGDYRIAYHLAPPLLARRDANTGLPKKSAYGPWMGVAFKLLARLKGLRKSRLDPFGWTAERRAERALRDQYLADIAHLSASLGPASHATAVQIAEIPEQIRGYGHVKSKAMAAAAAERERLLATLAADPSHARAA